jgi:hypothetical protein
VEGHRGDRGRLRYTEAQQKEILDHFIAGWSLTTGAIMHPVTSATQVQDNFAFATWQAGDVTSPTSASTGVRPSRFIFAHSNANEVGRIWEPNWEPTAAASRRRQATTS